MGRKKSFSTRNIDTIGTSRGEDRRRHTTRTPGFVLREDIQTDQGSDSHGHLHGAQGKFESDVAILLSEFGDLGIEVVKIILSNHDGDLESAWKSLEILAKPNDLDNRQEENVNHIELKESGPIGGNEGDPCGEVTGQAESQDSIAIPSWDVLPEDCKRIIWSMLSWNDLFRAAATSKEWHKYSTESRSWITFLSVNRNMNTVSMRSMISSHHQSEKIKIDYRNDTVGSVLWVDAQKFYSMMRLGEQDRRANDPAEIVTILINGSDKFNQDELGCLLHEMSHIKELYLSNCPNIGDDDVYALGNYRSSGELGTSLLKLSLNGTKLSQKGLKDLMNAMYSSELMYLDVSQSRLLTSLESLKPSNLLMTLAAKNCPCLKKVDLNIHHNCFRKLELQNCVNLEDVHISFVYPQSCQFYHLNISGCRRLKILSLDCPQLEILQAAACSHLKLSGPYISALRLPKLEHLNLNGCREVDDEGLSLLLRSIPLGLKTLNVGGCINLTDIAVEFQAVENCTMDAYGCSKLKNLSIRSPESLDKLVISGCRRLVHLTIVGRKPKTVKRNHCESLSRIDI